MTDERRDPKALERLLDVEPDAVYLSAWSASLKRSVFARLESHDRGGLIFRLGEQWLMLPLDVLAEVHERVPVRSVPGRTTDVFRGMVNLRGELDLCADMHALLGIDRVEAGPESARRLLVLDRDGVRWTFEADEVRGVDAYARDDLLEPQVTVSRALVHYTDGLLVSDAMTIARLDPERVFRGLEECLG